MTGTRSDRNAINLSAEELELLARLLEQEGIESTRSRPVPRERDVERIPLSFGQERLWFLDQLEPGSALRKIPRAYQLIGPLDVPALEKSFDELVRRHEALRTTFSAVDGQPVQIVAPALTLPLPVVDLQQRPEREQQAEVEWLAEEDARLPFDLCQGPLLRATLIRLSDDEHVLLFCIHHIVTDGWSMGILRRELRVLYNAFSSGEPSPLPELPIQYADYALWQREWLQGGVLERQLAYWRQQLDAAPPTLDLPRDHRRPAGQTYSGQRLEMLLPPGPTHQLKILSQREGATLFMTLLAAFDTLLFRLTGQPDIVVGTPIAGRNRPETEGLIGFFLNSLVLRSDLSGQPTFLNLLHRVRETTLAAYDHQDLPFEKLLEELQPERDLSRTPLFQVFFNMLPGRDRPWELRGLRISRIPHKEIRSNFDLTAYVTDLGETVRVSFVYNTNLFNQERMAEMVRQYQHLLVQIAENPERRVSEYSLVTTEAQTVLPEPSLPLSDRWYGPVHDQLAWHAQTSPSRPAIVDNHGCWTYGQLNLWSNRLANYLLAEGIQSHDVVAIYGHRSAALVWAILGILKAGAAFLILDPAYPAARLAAYLPLAEPRGWIQIHAAGDVPEEITTLAASLGIRCQVTLPSLAGAPSHGQLAAQSDSDPGLEVGPDDLAYVAFTSGSTGQPKGILGRHGPLSHFLPWQQEAFGLASSDRFSVLSGLSHDPLQRDIFTPLWVGATICIPQDDTIGTPGQLAAWMAQERVTFAHLTPAMSRLLTETAGKGLSLPSLRHAFFVGDRLTRTDVERLISLAPNVTCTNSYGSTETQRAVAYYPIPPLARDGWTRSIYPLGSGMPDVQLLVFNAIGEVAGIGELGEIHVRSPHLARGYLGDETLTRQRFLPNPFTKLENDRLYKTGDLGRYLPDGSVEFAGRDDQQVKIRGFRIELGEIEAALQQRQDVKEAIVLAQEERAGQTRLVAYVVPEQDHAPTTTGLRELLSANLPDYMVPSAFVLLDSLPLTPNGKLDYRALPEPDALRAELESTYVAPRTPDEETLAGIWSQVLGVQRVGVHDNFFEMGGHSLLGVRLFALINKAFSVELPLAALFRAPTIERLAGLMRAMENPGALRTWSLVTMQSGGTRPPLFVIPGNLGNVLVDLGHLSNYLGQDQPFYGLQDWTGNPTRIEALAAEYVKEIQEVQALGPYLLAGVCSGAVVALEMAQQLRAQGHVVSWLAMVEPSRPHLPGLKTYTSFALSLLRQLRSRLRHSTGTLFRHPRTGEGEYVRLKLKVIANRWALRRYLPQPYPGRIDIFLTEQSLRSAENHQLEWRRWATEGIQVHEIPGSHATIVGLHDVPIEETHMRVLADKMKGSIDDALASGNWRPL